MLLLGAKSFDVDGVTVFPDHADPNQWWYLPAPVTLAKPAGGAAAFTFIKYRPAVVEAGVKGGGFVMFDTQLRLPDATRAKIISQAGARSPGEIALTSAFFDEGTVKCVALNLEGSGGTQAKPAPAGAFNAVEQILGATIPSLEGDEDAIFSLTLSQEGATILEQAYRQGTGPIGVIYTLKFTAMRPALDVKITADFKRMYEKFSASLEGQYYFLKVSIDAAFEELVQEGAIKIEVTRFSDSADAMDKEKWALDFFKENLLKDWFTPTLTPGKVQGEDTGSGGLLGAVLPKSNDAGSASKPGATDKTTGAPATAAADKTGAPANKTTAPAADQPAAPKDSAAATQPKADAPPPQPAQPVRQAATIEKTRDPALPHERDATFKASASGTREQVTFIGGGNPVVTLDGQPAALDAGGTLSFDVAAAGSHDIVATYAATDARTETFKLRFTLDLPHPDGFSDQPPSPAFQRYIDNRPAPDDPEFKQSAADAQDVNLGGADALRDWAQNRLVAKEVTIDAHASFENKSDAPTVAWNQQLSERRLKIAKGILDGLVTVTQDSATGETEAQQAGRVGNRDDRAANIHGTIGAQTPGGTIRLHVSRPADVAPKPAPAPAPAPAPKPAPSPTPDPKPSPAPATPQPKAGGDDAIAGAPQVALKLRFVRQEEQKTLVFEYHEQEATQRVYAPQGFFGLMLDDLADDDKHFVEVDLNDPFFQTFTVTVDAPIDFARIGLLSVHGSLAYGSEADAAHLMHDDFIFDTQNHAQHKWSVFADAQRDMSYRYAVEYHFDSQADWDADASSFAFDPKQTEDRSLFLNPYENLSLLEVAVMPNRLDAVLIASTDVHLNWIGDNGQARERVLTVVPGGPVQTWRVRRRDPAARDYTWWLVHHLKDGTTQQTKPVTTSATTLPVDDSFQRPLEIDFLPLFDPAATGMAFVDVTYDDPTNHYHREERIEMSGPSRAPVHLHLPVLNPDLRAFKFRTTFVGIDNSVRRGDFSAPTEETLIAVQ